MWRFLRHDYQNTLYLKASKVTKVAGMANAFYLAKWPIRVCGRHYSVLKMQPMKPNPLY